MKSRTPARPPPLSVGCSTFVNCGACVASPTRRDDRRREVDDAIEIFVIDLVGGVRRPVIVGVRAGEEVQARHAGLVEAGDVGRLIRILLHQQVEAGGDVGLFDQPRPHAGSCPVACTVSLLSCIRPTMSKFKYAAS